MQVLERFSQENARSYALRVLTYNIIKLELEPGSAVSENELSSILNISRTPVREALIELHKQQLVEIYPQRGSYISKIDYSLIEETRFMRITIENAIVQLACEGISDEYMQKLEHNLSLQRSCLEANISEELWKYDEVLWKYDEEFHKLLFQSVNKSKIYDILKMQMIHFDRLRVLLLKNLKDGKIIGDHENLLYAIKKHDKELAGMIMNQHLLRDQIDQDKLKELHPEYFKQ